MDHEPSEDSALQKQNYRLIKIFLAAFIILLPTIFVIYLSAEPPTADALRESLEARGYEVLDITEQYADDEYILNAFSIDTDNLYLEFYEVDNRETAASFCYSNVSFLEDEYGASLEYGQVTDYCQSNYLSDSDTFYAVACYENTCLYAYTDKQNKSGKEAIKKTVSEFIPPSLLLIIVFFLVGLLLQFLGLGFALQETSKRKRCNVLTTATVVGNEKELTSPMKSDRRKKYYGSGAAYSYSPTISYYANNEQYEETYGNGFVKPIPIGTKIEILYNSETPEEFCFANERRERPFIIAALIILLVGLALCGISVNMLLRVF